MTTNECQTAQPEGENTAALPINHISVSGIDIAWQVSNGTCTFQKFPVAMMWVDSTLAGLFSGVQRMVGTERFLLALQSEGRKSVEADWEVVSQLSTFREGFAAIANIAAIAGWGRWQLASIDEREKRCCFRIADSWEGLYQKSLGVKWGSGMLAGKMAGFCTKLFGTNCWAEQIAFIAGGDDYDEFIVEPSQRSIELEIENLLSTDEATRADMAVALKTLKGEIEERRQAEAKLRESEQRYRALIETTHTGYVILDVAGRVIDANQEYVRLTGHDRLDEIIGRSVIEWTAQQDIARNAQAVAQCLRDGFITNFAVHYCDASRNTRPIEICATVVGRGESRRILTLCRDISDRLEAERILQNAQKLESLGVLAGGIAHDFNNLLTGIFGYVEMARAGLQEGSEARGYIDSATTVFDRARALTQQLLTFSKGGAPAKRAIPLRNILTETVKFALSGSNVKDTIVIPDGLWSCDVDEHQIGQVIDNIVINARQATPMGGSVTLTARNVGEEETVPPPLARDKYVQLIIRDTGIGIPPDILPRIFDPFFTTKPQGSGLGLATAYSIMKRHGGHVYAESEAGRGAAFILYLPASKSESGDKVTESGQLNYRKGCRILLMDDEEFIRDIGMRFLEEMGCDAMAAANGIEAVAFYQNALDDRKPFDLVILDLTIPGSIGGERTIEALLRIDPSANAIASSGHSNDPIMSEPTRYGFKAKLSKPYVQNEFRSVVAGQLAALGE